MIDNDGNHIEFIDFYNGGSVEFIYKVIEDGYCPTPNIHLYNQRGDLVLTSAQPSDSSLGSKGIYKTSMKIPAHFLNDGRFIAGIATSTFIPERIHFYEQEALVFDVIEDMNLRETEYRGSMPGVIRPKFQWTYA